MGLYQQAQSKTEEIMQFGAPGPEASPGRAGQLAAHVDACAGTHMAGWWLETPARLPGSNTRPGSTAGVLGCLGTRAAAACSRFAGRSGGPRSVGMARLLVSAWACYPSRREPLGPVVLEPHLEGQTGLGE